MPGGLGAVTSYGADVTALRPPECDADVSTSHTMIKPKSIRAE